MEPNFPNLERDLCLAIHELKVKPACAIRLTGVAFIAYVWGRRTEWKMKDEIPFSNQVRNLLISAKDKIAASATKVAYHFLDTVRCGDAHAAHDFCKVASGFQLIRELTHGHVLSHEMFFDQCLDLYLTNSNIVWTEADIPDGTPRSHTWWWRALPPPE